MTPEIITTPNGAYARCQPGSGTVHSEHDVLDLIGLCGQIDTNRVLLTQSELHPDFFNLSSGLAGNIFNKITNYYIKTAIVADLSTIPSPRFQELAYELNKGNQINIFPTLAAAEAWLLS